MSFFGSLGGILAAPFTAGASLGGFDKGRSVVNSLPLVGGLASQIWGDPSQEAVQHAYKQAQQDLAKQRAYQMQGRMNAMNQMALAFGPRNQMLGEMMGMGPGHNAMDLGPMLQNPMPQAQQQDIRTAAFGPPQQPQMSREEQAIRGMGQYKGY